MSQTSPVRAESFSHETIYFTQINLHSFDRCWPCEWKRLLACGGFAVMHGLISPVTIPRGQSPRQVQPFGPWGGELFEAVPVPGVRGWGKSRVSSLWFCEERVISRARFLLEAAELKITRLKKFFSVSFAKINLDSSTYHTHIRFASLNYSSPSTLRQIPAFSLENT